MTSITLTVTIWNLHRYEVLSQIIFFSMNSLEPLISFFKGNVTRNTPLHIYIVTCSFFDKTTTKGKSTPANVSSVSEASYSTSIFHDMSWFFYLVLTLPSKYTFICFIAWTNSYYVQRRVCVLSPFRLTVSMRQLALLSSFYKWENKNLVWWP